MNRGAEQATLKMLEACRCDDAARLDEALDRGASHSQAALNLSLQRRLALLEHLLDRCVASAQLDDAILGARKGVEALGKPRVGKPIHSKEIQKIDALVNQALAKRAASNVKKGAMGQLAAQQSNPGAYVMVQVPASTGPQVL